MATLRHPEFRKELENTKYPFVSTATLSNEDVNFLEGTFIDAHLYSASDNFRLYISRVDVGTSSMTIVIGNEEEDELLTGEISLPVSVSAVRLVDLNGISAGILITEPERLSLISAWGLGSYEFLIEATEFCITCCMPVPQPGVTALRLENGELLSGKVWLMGGDGVIINTETKINRSGEVERVLKLNIVGEPLYLQKLCFPEDLFSPPRPLKKITVTQDGQELHSCGPDEYGNFNIQMNDGLVADPALRVRTTPDGILFTVEGDVNTGV